MESFSLLIRRPSLKRVSLWRPTIESKFGLLCCIEHQKTLFALQQLLKNAGAWWVNYIAAHPTNYQVSWAEFRDAFCAHHIPVGIMKRKHQEFMDLKQGGSSMHDYSKLFNHLAQYALEQVDINEKLKYHFMNDFSIKLQERLMLNTGETFPKFVSNAIIADDMIHAHKESKKRKTGAAPSSSISPKYRMVCVPHHAQPHRSQQHQHEAPRPHQHQQRAP
jgi:hypothetical protein